MTPKNSCDDFIPTGPRRTTKSGNFIQAGIASIPVQPFPEPQAPTTKGDNLGWIKEERRDASKLQESDWNFKYLIERAGVDALAANELVGCAWYEYARECAKLRAVAATYATHFRLSSGAGRRKRHYGGIDKWEREREENRKQMRPKVERLLATLNVRVQRLKERGLDQAAEVFGRRWWQRINDIEIKDPTGWLEWMTCDTWFRIEWLGSKVEKRAKRLRDLGHDATADQFESRWKTRLEKMSDAERAWREADEWMNKVQGRCSLGAPCFLTLASWIAEDCPWQEIRDETDPQLNVRGIAVERGPKADDSFSKVGRGKHPIPGLTGGLQLNRGFETVSPRSVFSQHTGSYSELLLGSDYWTERLQFKDYMSERFVGQIVWNRPDSEIMEDFEKWVKWRRSKLADEFRALAKRPSRTRWDDPAAALGDLAALRLRARFGAVDGSNRWAELYSEKTKAKDLDKGNQEILARQAAKSAEIRAKTLLEEWALDSSPEREGK